MGIISDRPVVLVVDDDVQLLNILFNLLERAGYCVIGTKTGRSGVGIARTLLPDLVVMDLAMRGGWDGFDAIKALRRDAATRSIPVVVCSVANDDYERARADALGVEAFIPKPFGHAAMVELVRKLVDGAGRPAQAA